MSEFENFLNQRVSAKRTGLMIFHLKKLLGRTDEDEMEPR